MIETLTNSLETPSGAMTTIIQKEAKELSESVQKVDDIIKKLESGAWTSDDKIDLNPLTADEFGKIVEAANKSPHYENLTFTHLETFTEGMAKKLSKGMIETITFENFNPKGESLEEFKKAMNSLSNIASKSPNISFNFPDFDTDDVDFVKTLTEKKLLDRSIGIKNPSPEMITALMKREVIGEESGKLLDTHYSSRLTLPHLENLTSESAETLLTYTKQCQERYKGTTNAYPSIELGLKTIPEDLASNEEGKKLWNSLLSIPGCLRLPNITKIPDAFAYRMGKGGGPDIQLPNCTFSADQIKILRMAGRKIQAQNYNKRK